MKKIREYFASANSTAGFINNFDSINCQSQAGMLYILKGGSGTGKSTLMKKVGEHFHKRGYDIELFYCSSDPQSLDGIRLPEFNIAIIDGTSPHITETTMPSISEKIIDLGQYINENVAEYKAEVLKLLLSKKQNYKMVYACLKSWGTLKNAFFEKTTLPVGIKFDNMVKRFISKSKFTYSEQQPRKLFLTSLGKPDLLKNIENNKFTTTKQIKNKTAQSLLNRASKIIIDEKINATIFYDDIFSNNVVAILNPVNDTLFYITPNKTSARSKNKEQHEINKIGDLLIKTVNRYLQLAKTSHSKIEKIYFGYVNFKKISQVTINIIKEIEDRI